MTFGKTVSIESQLQIGNQMTPEETCASAETRFLALLKTGDAEAFECLINHYSSDVYGLLLRLTNDAEEARDLTQETFLQAFRYIADFRGDAGLKTWLYRIALNQARNRWRWLKRRMFAETVSLNTILRRENSEESELSAQIADETSISPEHAALEREREQLLTAALQKLPKNFREAVILRDIEGFGYEEVAAALETNIGTVKSRIARGRIELKNILKNRL